MSYQVIARKYRPQKFSDVIGQDHVTRTLQNAIEAKRLHHAYLLTGVRGVGKTTVARILAKALNCEKPNSTEPCCECKSCVEIRDGIHMDVHEIDGASTNGVDDVREIREQIKYLPSHGKYKIYIIDEVHMLTNNAFNALLKTLEEPPAHVIFMFATTEPQKLPATILSRCQRYDFRRVALSVIADSLKKIATAESITVEPDALLAISAEADGSMRDAQSLFDQAVAFSGKTVTYANLKEMLGFMDRKQLREILGAIADRDASRALAVVDEVFEQGGDLARLAQEMLNYLRGVLVFSATKDQAFLKDVPSEEKDFIGVLAVKRGIDAWEQIFKVAYQQTEEVSRSKFPKMALESMLIQLTRVREGISTSELIEKIDMVLAAGAKAATAQPQFTAPASVPKKNAEPAAELSNPAERKILDEEEWKGFVKWLVTEKPQLYSILEQGIFSGTENGSVVLSYANESIGGLLNDGHRKIQLDELTQKHFGKKYGIVPRYDLTAAPVAEVKKAKIIEDKERTKRLKEEAMSHDVVKQAAALFEADIKEINIKQIKE